jgi:hypothetical protein
MPKGEKLRSKQMDQLPLENFENSRVRIWFVKVLLLSKIGLLWGEFMIMRKRGDVGTFSQSQGGKQEWTVMTTGLRARRQ